MNEEVSTAKAATMLGVSEETVRNLCIDGVLTARKDNRGRWKITIDSIETWIQNNRRARRRKWITWGGIGTILAILLATSGFLADWAPARQQLQQWGFLSNYSKAKDGEILIVVFDFYNPSGVVDTEISDEIARAVRTIANENKFPNLRVVLDARHPRADEKELVRNIGQGKNAAIVIWGEDTGVRITVNFLNIKSPQFHSSDIRIEEIEESQIRNPSEYATFITTDLPKHLTALSSFAIGQSYAVTGDMPSAISMLEMAIFNMNEGKEFEGQQFAHLILGWLYQYSGQDKKALKALNEALRIDPAFEDALNNRGVLLAYQYDRLDDGIADLEKANLIEPNDKYTLMNLASVYSRKKEYATAIDQYKKVIELDPEFYYAYVDLGSNYNFTGDSRKAIELYDQAITLNPELAAAYFERGVVYKQIQNFPAAVDDFTKAISQMQYITKEKMLAYLLLGDSYYQQSKFEEAISSYSTAIKEFPEVKDVYCFNCGVDLLRLHNYDLREGELYCRRGATYFALGQYSDAIRELNLAQSHFPELETLDWSNKKSVANALTYNPLVLIDMFLIRGRARMANGDALSAVDDFSKALQIFPPVLQVCADNDEGVICPPDYQDSKDREKREGFQIIADIYFYKGLANRQLYKSEQSIADYDMALLYWPENHIYYNNRGNVFMDLEEYSRAILDFDKAISLSPREALAYVNRANAYFHIGDYDKSLLDSSTAIEIDPNNAEGYYWHGMASEKLKYYAQAISDFKKYLILEPKAFDYQEVSSKIKELQSKVK